MLGRRQPYYTLASLQARVASGEFVVTKRVERYLSDKRVPPEMPMRCVSLLTASDFHRSVPHLERPDVWLDIYRPVIMGERWYVKVVMHEDGVRVVFLSCCRDGEVH